jgi:nuclear pore complex protein Nup155
MGLFPEIGRAWLSIDSDVFLWNYEDGGDLAYFDGMNEAILCVGLITPKTGIFQEHIKYLLCLATAVDIVLLGVSFSVSGISNMGEMHLQPDPLYTLQSNGVQVKSIKGTKSGRIFLCGGDGCLYEIYYQARDGWFTPRCKLINHSVSKLSFLLPSFLSFGDEDAMAEMTIDGSRNILYTRSKAGVIQVFDLGWDGLGLSRVTSTSQEDIARKAALATRTTDEKLFKPLIHISAMTASDSPFLHLVAVSEAGVRLYFTTCSLQPGVAINPTARPVHIALVHCRMPPGYSPSTATHKPTNIHAAFYKQGTLLLASAQTEDIDSLWWVHSDSFPVVPNQNILHESQMSLDLGGRTLAIEEVPTNPFHISLMTPVGKAMLPVIASQHVLPQRQFVVLSTQGTCLCSQIQPVEQLRQLLMAARGADSDALQAFFHLHKADQACAMCLILATSTAPADQQVAQWATVAFFRYGGEPSFSLTSPTTVGPGGIGPQQQGPGYSGGQPALNQSQLESPAHPALGRAVIRPDIIFSGKHNGLCLYFGRLVAPFWETTLVSNMSATNTMAPITSRFTPEDLQTFSNMLTGLISFLDKNQQFVNFQMDARASASPGNVHRRLLHFISPHQQTDGGGVSESLGQAMQRKHQVETLALERSSLSNISQLVQRTIESLALWRVICEHGFTTIANKLQQGEKDVLRRITFKDFVVNGKQLCDGLVRCLMDQYISDSVTTDNVSGQLRDLCPSLFSQDDAIVTKANETLALARATENTNDKNQLLEDSLQLFSQVSHRIDLSGVCTQYGNVGFHVGVVDLSLCTAEQRDPQGLALHHYKSRQPAEDIAGQSALAERLNACNCM